MISRNSSITSKLLKLNDEELIEYYIRTKSTLSPKTPKNYRVLLTQFFNYCYDYGKSMIKVSEIEVSDFIANFEYKSTKDSYRTILNIFYKWCFKHRLIDHNPVEDIVIKSGKRKKQVLMQDKEFKDILSRSEGLREMCIVSMFWYTGVRAKELRGMKVEDIDLEKGLIHITNSKTMNGYRIIPIHPNFKNLLSQYIRKRNTLKTSFKELFLTKKGSTFSESTIIHLVSYLQRDLFKNGKSFSCHDFRRAFITRLHRKTRDLVLCQRLAGHASINTTRKYILDDIEEHMRKFNGINF